MNEKQCKYCKYYLQHYSLDKKKIFRVYCGHCTFSGAKRKQPDTHACENFIPGDADTDAFATKEYISKALLQYLLSLEPLPEIEEYPTTPKQKATRG